MRFHRCLADSRQAESAIRRRTLICAENKLCLTNGLFSAASVSPGRVDGRLAWPVESNVMIRSSLRILAAAALALVIPSVLASDKATAFDYNMQTRYAASMAGFKFANFSFDLSLIGDQYKVTSEGRARGLAWLFTNAQGTAETSGRIIGSKLLPSQYLMTSRDRGKSSAADIIYRNKSVAAFSAQPPFKDADVRVPLTNENLNRTIDPLTAMLAGFGIARFDKSACQKTISVFDGWQQFDLKLSFHGVEEISIAGYRGPAIACAMRYRPIGGHKPALQGVLHLSNGSHRLWLVPTNTDRGLVLAKMSIDTIMGPLRVSLTNLTLTRRIAAAVPGSAEPTLNGAANQDQGG